MTDERPEPETEEYHYVAKEAVAIFDTAQALEAAIDELQIHGFDRSDFSLLAGDGTVARKLGHRYRQVEELEDDAKVPQAAFIEHDSVVIGEALSVGVLSYIGVVAGSLAVVASGGALGAALIAAAAGGVAGGGVGGLLARFISQRYAHYVEEQIEKGGLLLWVTVRDDAHEKHALEILKRSGGRDVHIHDLDRTWSAEDKALYHKQPDPWLIKE